MNLSQRAQTYLSDNLTLEDALPTQMPVYVKSATYLFGVSALSGLAMLVITGLIMVFVGPAWYHLTRVGRFFNSLHFWSVQVFFLALVLHFITKFFIAGWRDKRWGTWTLGLISLGVGVFTGLTGFLMQTNWDSQWISVQAKDAMNALGIGSFFNTMNFTQVFGLHIFFLPVVLVLFVAFHLFFVRREGPVKPIQRGGTR